MTVTPRPAGPAKMDVTVPGSKSLTNRALIAAALADGETRITHASASDDSRILSAALNGAGIPVAASDGEIRVRGMGGRIPATEGEFMMGNAGTALRFLTSFLCLGRGRYVVDGDARMRQRPIGGLIGALRGLGADIEARNGCPPVEIRASGLRGGRTPVDGKTSSQFISSLLLSAPGAEGDVTVTVEGEAASKPYIDMSIDIMREMGVEVGRDGHREFRVEAAARYRPGRIRVAGDGASANYWLAMAAVTGGRATVRGVGRTTRQGELKFAGVLERMGCEVRVEDASITVRGGRLCGVDEDMNDMPDSVQTLACMALFADGPTRARNVANLRVKETDRITALAQELSKLGARVDQEEDGLTVHPPEVVGSAEIETYNDHRMAMSFAVAGTAAPGIAIVNPGCVTKSYPGFFEELERQGVEVERR